MAVKMKRIEAHPAALIAAVAAIMQSGKGGMEGLDKGIKIKNALEEKVPPGESVLNPYLPAHVIEAAKAKGQNINPDERRHVDLSEDHLAYLKDAVWAMAEKATPENAMPFLALRDAINGAKDVEYGPKAD